MAHTKARRVEVDGKMQVWPYKGDGGTYEVPLYEPAPGVSTGAAASALGGWIPAPAKRHRHVADGDVVAAVVGKRGPLPVVKTRGARR
jgi:hypothetical protein